MFLGEKKNKKREKKYVNFIINVVNDSKEKIDCVFDWKKKKKQKQNLINSTGKQNKVNNFGFRR